MDQGEFGTEQLCDTPTRHVKRNYVGMGVSAVSVRDALLRHVAIITAVLVVVVLIVAFVQLSYTHSQNTCPVCTCDDVYPAAHAQVSNCTVSPTTSRTTTRRSTTLTPTTMTTTPTTTPTTTTTTSPTTTTRFQCPPTLPLTFQSSCYAVIELAMSQADATQYCRFLAPTAHLVDITSQAEQDWITFWGRQRGANDMWTCATRLGPSADDFVWSTTNATLVYTYWDAGEPNNTPVGENCIHVIVEHGGRWNDRDCDHKRASVCEYP